MWPTGYPTSLFGHSEGKSLWTCGDRNARLPRPAPSPRCGRWTHRRASSGLASHTARRHARLPPAPGSRHPSPALPAAFPPFPVAPSPPDPPRMLRRLPVGHRTKTKFFHWPTSPSVTSRRQTSPAPCLPRPPPRPPHSGRPEVLSVPESCSSPLRGC